MYECPCINIPHFGELRNQRELSKVKLTLISYRYMSHIMISNIQTNKYGALSMYQSNPEESFIQ